jgi:protein-tyrosine phosphatase
MATTYALCDMHCHLLPGMDDGCQTVEESIQVLRASYDQGVRQIFATPHYYPVETVEAFLDRRAAAMECLLQRMEQETEPLPKICLGAEVAYRPGLGYEENLDKLCLGSSRYLLLEMPFSMWNEEVVRSVRSLCNIQGITPILAHIERYLSVQPRDMLMDVLEQEVLLQMNVDNLLQFSMCRKAKKLLKSGMVQLLGSDCHNMTTRKPNLGPGVAYLEKKGMTRVIRDVTALSRSIFREATR